MTFTKDLNTFSKEYIYELCIKVDIFYTHTHRVIAAVEEHSTQ